MVKPMDSQQEYVLRAVEERDIRIMQQIVEETDGCLVYLLID